MKTKLFISLLTAILVNATVLNAQTFNKAKADSLLSLLSEKNKAMGSLAVSEKGNLVYARAIGFADVKAKKPSDVNTKYRIGSISKMFTATLIFQLIEEGKLELSTTLDKFYPSVANAKKVTIGNLLNHRSGIHSFTNDQAYQQWMTSPKTRKEMISIISEGKIEFEPDTKTEYSNSNFVLLGYIVEDLRKKSYNEILQKHICAVAGLRDTYYGGKTDISKNESYSYRLMSNWDLQPETDMSIPHGAGAIVSTASDLVKFASALFTGKLVSEKSLNQMKTIKDGMGMGMQKFPYENKTVFGHGGGIDGFSSLLCYLPEEKLAVCYVSNGAVYSVNEIVLKTINISLNKPFKLPEFTTYELKPEDLERYPGVYASPQIPVKITLFKNEGKLFGQGTGQAAFPLEATAKDNFKFETAGITIRFDPVKPEFVMEQGGGKFTFTRE
jgi:CubicO group peptidase (beta-lactamase class C family)